ncbi:MAG: hypothetical protein NTW58_08700 [Actinobacteria bacterium]|nr:hypothetical protein [Actinomycetota bacterium]
MSAPRAHAGGSRRARALAILVLLLVAAAGTTGCRGSSSAAVGPFLGTWQRVEAGAPNPEFTLTIAAQGDGVELTFANLGNGMSESVAGTVADGSIACTLPNADGDSSASPLANVPTESDLRLSPGEDGRLVVDLVLPGGALEPIWTYQRADEASLASP